LVWIELQRPVDAIEDLTKTLEYKPEFLEARMFRATLSFDDEEFDQCIKDCDYMIGQDPKNSEAFYYRGMAHGGKGNDKLAIQDFDKAIEFNPKNDDAICRRGAAKFLSGNKKGACMDWNKAKALGNEDAEQYILVNCVEAVGE
jgi:tetratricopeptide (TPR) repeat protein